MESYNSQDSKSVRNISVAQSCQKLLTLLDFQKSKNRVEKKHTKGHVIIKNS